MVTGLPQPSPLLVVLSGPSGVGKDAVLAQMKALGRPYHFTVTVTTRPRRAGEIEGQDYYFFTLEEFQRLKEGGGLLEWALVYGHWYGVPRNQVREALERGRDVIIKADVQGAATIKGLAPQGVFIFLAPPSLEDLEARLRQRRTELALDMELRLRVAREEMKRLPMFDYVVVNHEVSQAVAQIEAVIAAEKCRALPRVVRL